MTNMSRRTVLGSSLALAACSAIGSSRAASKGFECPPCGCSMDDVVFEAPGRCPDCGMTLRPVVDQDLGLAPGELPTGAGSFQLLGSQSKPFTVHYFRPADFTADSRILLVMPGAGRNSADYRNTWLAAAVEQGILVAALGYPEDDFDFAAYNMGGLVRDLSFKDPKVARVSRSARAVSLDDENISFELNPDAGTWLFNDFDRAFDHIVAATGSGQQRYDIFGHSAGGQILHRMVLFQASSRANRIVAANTGFYTLPLFDQALPTGLGGTLIDEAALSRAFTKRLIVMVGENDSSEAAGGTLLKTPLVNQQGAGRLHRGRFFYETAKRTAESFGSEFNWSFVTVSGVGHDFEAMSPVAADLLFHR